MCEHAAVYDVWIQMRSSIILAEFTIGFKCSLCTWNWSYTIWGGPPFSFETSGQHQSCLATCFVEPFRSPFRTFPWLPKFMTCMLSDEFRQKLRALPCCLLMCLCQAKKISMPERSILRSVKMPCQHSASKEMDAHTGTWWPRLPVML